MKQLAYRRDSVEYQKAERNRKEEYFIYQNFFILRQLDKIVFFDEK